MTPATKAKLDTYSPPTQKRFDLGEFGRNLGCWKQSKASVEEKFGPEVVLPTFESVLSMDKTPGDRRVMEYARNGLEWSSDSRVYVKNRYTQKVERVVVIHLPNDGCFYVEDSLLDCSSNNRNNQRHRFTCPEGWAYLRPTVWTADKLEPFLAFAKEWFGYRKIRKSAMYNAKNNRLDILFLSPETNVKLEFSFEQGYPLYPRDDDEYVDDDVNE
ncbi:MAG: hypothetical protein SGILL_006578 [Bacillariaceae sp.]